ncbi:MAG TPA: hypothetical protein VN222_07855, partial [Novosphingobium sp.]|nr:hypothetical protein [Novosphingobium sp.]
VTLPPASIDALQKGILADLLPPGLAIEVLGSGRKRWRYRRQVAGTDIMVTMFGQAFPAQTIAGRLIERFTPHDFRRRAGEKPCWHAERRRAWPAQARPRHG